MTSTGSQNSKKRTYVLLHGAWHGGWCWRSVATRIEHAGHRVLAPSLSGLGDRQHLSKFGLNLSTHVEDIVNLVRFEDLNNIFLVAHSYGGFVASGVAEYIAPNISSIFFMDAFLPLNGERLIDVASENTKAVIRSALDSNCPTIQPPPLSAFGIEDDRYSWTHSKMTPQPVETFLEHAVYRGARDDIAHKYYLRANAYPSLTFDANLQRATADGWITYNVDCHHDAMIVEPKICADLLLSMNG